MRIGRLKHRVTVQSKTTQDGPYGEPQVTWNDVVTTWAAVEPLRGREFFEAQADQSETEVRIVMRHREIATDDRIVHQGKVYDIQSIINPDEVDHMLEIMCTQGVTEG